MRTDYVLNQFWSAYERHQAQCSLAFAHIKLHELREAGWSESNLSIAYDIIEEKERALEKAVAMEGWL
jgi:predicted transglutaminase-like cysteine proteinase